MEDLLNMIDMKSWRNLLFLARMVIPNFEKDMGLEKFIDMMPILLCLISKALSIAKKNGEKEECEKEAIEIYSQFLETKAAKKFFNRQLN